jgi:hypothetical protein
MVKYKVTFTDSPGVVADLDGEPGVWEVRWLLPPARRWGDGRVLLGMGANRAGRAPGATSSAAPIGDTPLLPRLIRRPAPWLQDSKDSGWPSPSHADSSEGTERESPKLD